MTLAVKIELTSMLAIVVGIAMISLPLAIIVGGALGVFVAQGLKQ